MNGSGGLSRRRIEGRVARPTNSARRAQMNIAHKKKKGRKAWPSY